MSHLIKLNRIICLPVLLIIFGAGHTVLFSEVKVVFQRTYNLDALELKKPMFLGVSSEGAAIFFDQYDKRLIRFDQSGEWQEKKIGGQGPGEMPGSLTTALPHLGASFVWIPEYQKRSLSCYDFDLNFIDEVRFDTLLKTVSPALEGRIYYLLALDKDRFIAIIRDSLEYGRQAKFNTFFLSGGETIPLAPDNLQNISTRVSDSAEGGIKEKVEVWLMQGQYTYKPGRNSFFGAHSVESSAIDVYNNRGQKVKTVDFRLERLRYSPDERKKILNYMETRKDKDYAHLRNPVFKLPEYKPYYRDFVVNESGDILVLGQGKNHLYIAESGRIKSFDKLKEKGLPAFAGRCLVLFHDDEELDAASLKTYRLEY